MSTASGIISGLTYGLPAAPLSVVSCGIVVPTAGLYIMPNNPLYNKKQKQKKNTNLLHAIAFKMKKVRHPKKVALWHRQTKLVPHKGVCHPYYQI